MDRTLDDYLARGGTKAAIGECWAKSFKRRKVLRQVDSMVGRVHRVIAEAKGRDGTFRVEFDPANPKAVTRFYFLPDRREESVFFESEREGTIDERVE